MPHMKPPVLIVDSTARTLPPHSKTFTYLRLLDHASLQYLDHAFILIAGAEFVLQCGFGGGVEDALGSVPVVISDELLVWSASDQLERKGKVGRFFEVELMLNHSPPPFFLWIEPEHEITYALL